MDSSRKSSCNENSNFCEVETRTQDCWVCESCYHTYASRESFCAFTLRCLRLVAKYPICAVSLHHHSPSLPAGFAFWSFTRWCYDVWWSWTFLSSLLPQQLFLNTSNCSLTPSSLGTGTTSKFIILEKNSHSSYGFSVMLRYCGQWS